MSASNPSLTTSGRRLEWALGDLGPGQRQTIAVEYRVERAGTISHCAAVHTADGLRTEHCTSTQVTTAEAVLDIQLTGPQTAEMGGIASFQVVVINRGSAPATGLVIADRFDRGFEHAGDTERTYQIERSLGDLQPGASSQPIAITFNVVAAGRQCHEVEVRGDGGLVARRSAFVDVPERAGDVIPPVVPPTAGDPPAGAALEVEIIPPRQSRVGETVLLKLVVKNTGNVDLQNVVVEEAYSHELKPASATDDVSTDGRTLRWLLAQLPAGEQRVFEVEYNCLQATDINGARSTASASVGNLYRAAEANIEILPRVMPATPDVGPVPPPSDAANQSDLELRIAEYGDRVHVGERMTYSVSIDNKGQQSDTQLGLEVSFPLEMTPDVERINQTLRSKNIVASTAGQILRFSPIAEIRPGETILLTLSFNVNLEGPVRIRARLQSAGMSQPMVVEKSVADIAPVAVRLPRSHHAPRDVAGHGIARSGWEWHRRSWRRLLHSESEGYSALANA